MVPATICSPSVETPNVLTVSWSISALDLDLLFDLDLSLDLEFLLGLDLSFDALDTGRTGS